jgi:hypothetical protein
MSKPSVVLSPEEHEKVVELVKEGRTIKGIAEEFGFTARGVSSYLRRNNIEHPESHNGEKDIQKAVLQELLDRSKEVREKEKEKKSFKPESPREIFDPTPPNFKMRLITLEEKKQYDCSWIIGDPKKHYRYCGNSTIGVIGVYCEYHKNLSRNKQQVSTPKPYAPVNHK